MIPHELNKKAFQCFMRYLCTGLEQYCCSDCKSHLTFLVQSISDLKKKKNQIYGKKGGFWRVLFFILKASLYHLIIAEISQENKRLRQGDLKREALNKCANS